MGHLPNPQRYLRHTSEPLTPTQTVILASAPVPIGLGFWFVTALGLGLGLLGLDFEHGTRAWQFKQSVEWLRRLDTLEVLRSEVEWRVKAQGVGGGGGWKLSGGGCTIHLSCRWVVEEVIQFIWVIGGWWRRLYTLWRRLYTFVEEVIHPVEEVITLLWF